MNIFEDLIEELKEKNLLEETVIKIKKTPENGNPAAVTTEVSEKPVEIERRKEFIEETVYDELIEITKPEVDEKEFYRKRAVDEVSALQMVENVLTGIESENLRVIPEAYEEIPVKQALHAFLNDLGDLQSPEHADSEFHLMLETEKWCSALAGRDKNISAAHLRRYCEDSYPPLSSQALMALAKFYRNLPFSELIRGKFDFVITRLFSGEAGTVKRRPLFERTDTIGHLKNLYANWASIPLYPMEEDAPEVQDAVSQFAEFTNEVEMAETFDDLIKTDFFNRIRSFKEVTSKLGFAPLVTAAAIESNIRIGNSFVDLISAEKEKSTAESIQEKYGYTHDETISDTAGRTLRLVEILKALDHPESASKVKVKPKEEKADQSTAEVFAAKAAMQVRGKLLRVNKWLLTTTIVIVAASVGLYIWAEKNSTDISPEAAASVINLENSSLKEHIKAATLSRETMYGVVLPTWDGLSREKQEEFLRKALATGSDKGIKRVQLLDRRGKAVGFASDDKVEVYP